MLKFRSWATSDVGQKRLRNEDSFWADDANALYIVADGMGGHRGGAEASKLAVSSFVYAFGNEFLKEKNSKEALLQAFKRSALDVYTRQEELSSLKGMGTTLSAMAINNNEAHICHIGDSRVYMLRNGQLMCLTEDHSLVNEHVKAGLMSKEEARTSNLKNIITRAIGHDSNISADYFSIEPMPKDLFLLCTDGLSNMLTDNEIRQILNKNEAEKSIKILIDEANKMGGEDNITVILVEIF